MPSTSLVDSIDGIFSKKPKIAEMNKKTAIFSYNYASNNFENFNRALNWYTKTT